MKASVIIRTLNEERYLDQLLTSIEQQQANGVEVEIIVVDSGSSDSTLKIADRHNCRVIHIQKEQFTFGRSLNLGCAAAKGEFLVFISGHCIPVEKYWLQSLLQPLVDNVATYSYGRQVGNDSSRYSETQLFEKYFPNQSKIPQTDFFCNNANAALTTAVWADNHFDEDITGLEDMELAQRLQRSGKKIAYMASACVYHIHHESWTQVKRRYEREAYALKHIMPEVHIGFRDFLRYWISAVLFDLGDALSKKRFFSVFAEVVIFRFMQFWGSYRGNHEHRQLSRRMRERYFYPR